MTNTNNHLPGKMIGPVVGYRVVVMVIGDKKPLLGALLINRRKTDLVALKSTLQVLGY